VRTLAWRILRAKIRENPRVRFQVLRLKTEYFLLFFGRKLPNFFARAFGARRYVLLFTDDRPAQNQLVRKNARLVRFVKSEKITDYSI